MRKATIMGLVAAFALAAGASSAAASTLPEWGRCNATGGTGGKYTNPGCTEKARHNSSGYHGAYEWEPAEAEYEEYLKPMATIGTIKFETAAGEKIECLTDDEQSDTIAFGPRAASTPLWLFEGCTSEGQPCTATNAFDEEINDKYAWYGEPAAPGDPTPGWIGELGFISGAGTSSPVAGLSFAVKNDERLFEPVHCKGPIGTVWIGGYPRPMGHDSFISTIGPVNEMTDEFTQTYSESAPGVPNPTKFENRGAETLEANLKGHWEPVAMTATFRYEVEFGEETYEIKATR